MKAKTLVKTVGAGICVSAITLLLLFGCVVSVVEIFNAYRADAWPGVEAKVLSSRAVRGCGKGNSYSPEVRYTPPRQIPAAMASATGRAVRTTDGLGDGPGDGKVH